MKTVAFVGRSRPTAEHAPYDDPSIDIWAFNDYGFRHTRRLSALFEPHDDCLTTDRYQEDYRDWLRQPHDFPIWMLEAHPEIPAARRLPVELWQQTHLWKGDERVRDFYTSSTPYAIALAIQLKYERIRIYGIELLDTLGYRQQAGCIFFWLGLAAAAGIDVWAHPGSGLYGEALYGRVAPRARNAV